MCGLLWQVLSDGDYDISMLLILFFPPVVVITCPDKSDLKEKGFYFGSQIKAMVHSGMKVKVART